MIKSGMGSVEYYRRLIRLGRQYRRKKIRLENLPLRMWVELTAHCNLACVMCPNRELPGDQKGYLDPDLLQRIAEEAGSRVQEVNLCHRGESLLHPRLIPILKTAATYPWKTKLHTNGVLLTPELAEGIIESGLQRLSFSFDGTGPDEYERTRVGARFEEVVANIGNLLRRKKEKNSLLPRVAMEFIDLPDTTVRDRQRMKKLIREFRVLGLDEVVIKKPHNWAGAMEKAETGKEKTTVCTFLYHSLVVLWDGTVMPCAQDFFGHYPLENLRDLTLREIWNGPRLTALRKKHVSGDLGDLETCRQCDRIRRKTFLGIPTEFLKRMLLRRMP